ncbi:hypothetical protein [Sphingomonas sp. R86521]|uniref:hypothetical protein n=1 Tax=Sphingomonas sp. R86521 TaxID=3093860 RepID=UPI0036D240E7
MITFFALLLASGQALITAPALSPTSDQCGYGPKILDLGFDAFDQDATAGWRTLSMKPGCEEAAANMIRAYRMNSESYLPLLYWHEAQIRAELGHNAAAIPLMQKSRRLADQDKLGWNAYVDATISFLQNDRISLTEARDRLALLPKPNMFDPKRSWPPNIGVVDGLIRCFGKTYKIAYGPACRNQTK